MIAPTLPNPVIPVGVDDGYHQTKVVLGNGVTLSIPSTARLGRPDVLSLGRDGQADVQEYETEEVRYSAGRIEGEDTVFNEYPHSPLNRVIVHHALRMAGLSGKPVNLVTGLPVDSYFLKGRQAGPNKTLIERKIASLAVPVTPCDDTAPVEVRYHMVLAEGLAAYFDYVVDVDAAGVVSRNRVREKEQVAIIDIGGRTSDYAVIDGGRGIKLDESGSMEAGMLYIRKRLRQLLRERFPDMETISARLIDDAISTGRARLYGKDQDVGDQVRDAMQEAVSKIHNETRRRLGSGAELEKIIFVGGGSVALRPYIKEWFPHQHMPDDPVFANARGMYKYGRLTQR